MKAYLFDFNGTLFNDTTFHVLAWKKFIAERFCLNLTEEEVERRFIGPDVSDNLRSLMGEKYNKKLAELYSEEKESYYRRIVLLNEGNKALAKGAEEMLNMLKERRIPFALVTSSILSNVDFYLNELGISKWFTYDRIVYSDGKLRPKPEPDYYLEAAHRLGIAPQDCTAVEDTITGIQSAHAAGVGRIIAYRSDGNFGKIMPYVDVCISDFTGFDKFAI